MPDESAETVVEAVSPERVVDAEGRFLESSFTGSAGTHAFRLFVAGCFPAGLALVPLGNLLVPLFATALLVRVTQPIVRPKLLQPA